MKDNKGFSSSVGDVKGLLGSSWPHWRIYGRMFPRHLEDVVSSALASEEDKGSMAKDHIR